MVYANFDFYQHEYRGNFLTEADFERFAVKASFFIDRKTNGKAIDYADTDNVKLACCSLCDRLFVAEAGGEVISESVGSWSQTYKTSDKSLDDLMMSDLDLYLGEFDILVGAVIWV